MDAIWATIRDSVDCQVRLAPPPRGLVEVLPALLETIRRDVSIERISDPDLLALITAAVYGPREAGCPPQEIRDEMVSLVDASSPPRTIERILVRGALQPIGEKPWHARWERAVHGLSMTLEIAIRDSVNWLREKVGSVEFIPSVREEVRACARFLAEVLVAGRCSLCAAKWEDLRLQDLQTTLAHCTQHHRLASWDGSTPLDDFLRRAAEHTLSRVGIESRVNDFRRGMLSKVVGAGRLYAGYVLRCACTGEIQTSNQCARCRRTDGGPNPRHWWLWFEGQRRAAGCRECRECKNYYFTHGEPCPNRHSSWSKRDFVVWVRDLKEPIESRATISARRSPVDSVRLDHAVRERFTDDPVARRVAEALFLEGLEIRDAANRLGYGYPSAVFLDAVHRAAARLIDLFPEYDDAEADR